MVLPHKRSGWRCIDALDRGGCRDLDPLASSEGCLRLQEHASGITVVCDRERAVDRPCCLRRVHDERIERDGGAVDGTIEFCCDRTVTGRRVRATRRRDAYDIGQQVPCFEQFEVEQLKQLSPRCARTLRYVSERDSYSAGTPCPSTEI